MSRLIATLACLLFAPGLLLAAEPTVRTLRVPDVGLQPQVAADGDTLHLIYFKGDPAHGDVFYVRSTDGGSSFTPPIRVNSQPNSAVALGTIRGAQLALGRNGRVHVAWNGSATAEPRGAGSGNRTPMLYARLNDAATAFEPQRNVIATHYGLDGGGSVAADAAGHVYVAWHAPDAPGQGEASRRVWIARSDDDGKTFAPETAAFTADTGACGCCGMKLFATPSGEVDALFRSATEQVHRDIYLLRSTDRAATFAMNKVAPVEVATCVMSSASFAWSNDHALAAWETQGQVFWARVASNGAAIDSAVPAPGDSKRRKYPTLATDSAGHVLMAWADGTGWNKGGSIAWQLYDEPSARPLPNAAGHRDGLPAWSLTAACHLRDGFVIFY